VRVEYSTFGTNEDLYNRLNLGDTYDLVCPSDYMIMQLINEGKTEQFSESFLDKSIETNYYARNVSPYIEGVFDSYGWSTYAACYMLGTTGIVYNPEIASSEDVSSWSVLKNPDYKRQVTVKDNVRDSYFAALGILNNEELLSDEITAARRSQLLNSTDNDTIAAALKILKEIKDNVYSFETDSGKADMITGKVAANYQWSGDGVFIMDEADADKNNPTELWYSVPDECTNLWFDGWVMLKNGINGDDKKRTAAEAFVNFLSRPDNAIRNMYYIGYTSAIAGDTVFDYLDWNYGAIFDPEDDNFDSELNEICEYDLSYFFGDGYSLYIDASQIEINTEELEYETLKLGEEYGNNADYVVYLTPENVSRGRQVFAQYPPQSVIDRSVVMLDFGDRLGAINQMWINVRCLDVKDFNPAVVWSVVGIIFAG
ncbi:MAG: extracellular solute-binding protein, partial [Clostridia bacterium]|nr:extracellular solute-binding protein [Clostridia bacterium]